MTTGPGALLGLAVVCEGTQVWSSKSFREYYPLPRYFEVTSGQSSATFAHISWVAAGPPQGAHAVLHTLVIRVWDEDAPIHDMCVQVAVRLRARPVVGCVSRRRAIARSNSKTSPIRRHGLCTRRSPSIYPPSTKALDESCLEYDETQ